jgi:cathepsin C|eukprot:gnl/Ergobibamus_cyprinoides/493.p1 GENE.gnl/Ergobibamus_cyprinoides/493~~gnl/Ergobibamus_cyprinoides/493.p1  ORF type:complete len:494 (+),score=114.55 gnl/Ergobibamus_cyprinoides/493:72-1484(+)
MPDSYLGAWRFYLSAGDGDNTRDCSKGAFRTESTLDIELSLPNVAVDLATGVRGNWTAIYNQGFELRIGGRVYFHFADWIQLSDDPLDVFSLCDRSRAPAFFHDLDGTHWGCYSAFHDETAPLAADFGLHSPADATLRDREAYLGSPAITHRIAKAINHRNAALGLPWTAAVSPRFAGLTHGDYERMRGARNATPLNERSAVALATAANETHVDLASWFLETTSAMHLPENFQWSDVSGVDYLPPIRDQGQCGSCYTFGTTSMLNARLRILEGPSADAPVLSTQHIVSCAKDIYAQGCDGGFPMLVSKFAEDFGGLVLEDAFPYTADDATPCAAGDFSGARFTAEDYHYIGEYYGGCGDRCAALIMQELVAHGPVSTSFLVTDDFHAYEAGVYVAPDPALPRPYPGFFRETNHVVNIVGYGFDEELQLPYWTVANSWGRGWGEEGYFRIRLGTDELAIESMTVAATPRRL